MKNNVVRVCAELGGAAADVGDIAEADQWYAECEQVARSLGNDTMMSLAWLGYGTLARLRRDADEARRRFADALEVTSRTGMATQAVAALAGLAAAKLDAGEVGEAGPTLARASDACDAIGEAAMPAAVLEQRARLALARGDHGEAVELLGQATAVREAARRPRTVLELRDAEAVAAGGMGGSVTS